jgi:hypothetical protein
MTWNKAIENAAVLNDLHSAVAAVITKKNDEDN